MNPSRPGGSATTARPAPRTARPLGAGTFLLFFIAEAFLLALGCARQELPVDGEVHTLAVWIDPFAQLPRCFGLYAAGELELSYCDGSLLLAVDGSYYGTPYRLERGADGPVGFVVVWDGAAASFWTHSPGPLSSPQALGPPVETPLARASNPWLLRVEACEMRARRLGDGEGAMYCAAMPKPDRRAVLGQEASTRPWAQAQVGHFLHRRP